MDQETWAIIALLSGRVTRRLPGLGRCLEKAVYALKQELCRAEHISESSTASASNGHSTLTDEITLKLGQDMSLHQTFQKYEYKTESEYEMR